MESGENEFQECIQKLKKQIEVSITYFVVSGKPNKEAHDELYNTFMLRASEAEIFLKLDADMILSHHHILEQMSNYLKSNKPIMRLTVAVHDIISDQLVCGMHAWQNTMTWNSRDSNLYTDRSPLPHGKYAIDYKLIAPAARHCPNPSPFQAFHYGMHRGIKLTDSITLFSSDGVFLPHYNYYKNTVNAYKKEQLYIRILALIGFEVAIAGRLSIDDVNYTNKRANALFLELCGKKPEKELQKIWNSLRSDNKRKLFYYRICRFLLNLNFFFSFPLKGLKKLIIPGKG